MQVREYDPVCIGAKGGKKEPNGALSWQVASACCRLLWSEAGMLPSLLSFQAYILVGRVNYRPVAT